MSERTTALVDGSENASGFRHELYPYDGDAQFLTGAMSFIDDARAEDGVVLVSVAEPKERLLRTELEDTGTAASVTFVDAGALGRNPGRLIPAWQDWIAKLAAQGQPVRGISESPWSDRSEVETGELSYHEWLLNLAFAQSPAWWLLCPFDTAVVDPSVLEAAGRCHPLILNEAGHGTSTTFVDEPYAFAALTPPCDPYQELAFQGGDLAQVRAKVTACAAQHGLEGGRLRELLLAATEVAANSVKHGGGRGTLRTWVENSTLICEFHDAGHIQDPLVGRVRPTVDQVGGRGMWLVQQFCDLVQIRTDATAGTTIRLHVGLR